MTQVPSLLNLLSPHNIVIYMLIFTRLSGIMQTAPFFSTIQAPVMVRLWFSAIVAFILYPIVSINKSYLMPHNMTEFIILILLEFFIGFLIGFIANLFIEAVRISGNILSIQMGLSMSEALDPATGITSTELSRVYIYLATLIFISTGAYQMLFIMIFNSFNSIPIGVFPLFNPQVVQGMIQVFAQIFKIAFGVALPIFSVLLITDMLLGMTSKMMPQMNIYMVAIPIKIYIGLFLLLSFLNGTAVFLQGVIKNYMQAINLLFT